MGMYLDRYGKPCQLESSRSLTRVFREQLHLDSSKVKLVFSIEECWLVSTNILDSVRHIGYTNRTGLIYKCKVYQQSGEGWQPLVMIDTNLVSTKLVGSGGESILETALELTAARISEAIAEGKYKRRGVYSRIQLDSIWSQRYRLPIYTDSNFPKGLYMGLEDLRQNRPVDQPFRFEYTNEKVPLLYTPGPGGQESPAHSVKAVSDGRSLYIVYFGQAFPVFRQGRAFYCFGLTSFRERGASLPVFLPLGGGSVYGFERVNAKVQQVLSPLLVDIENGVLYL